MSRRPRPRFEDSRTWRVLSFVFGVVGPALIWSWIAQREFGTAPDYAVPRDFAHHVVWRGSALLVGLEIACMTSWLLHRPRSAAASRAFAILFGIGALFASAWALFSLAGLLLLLGQPEREILWRSAFGLVFACPFACVFVYGIHALVAWRARPLVRAA